MEKPRNGKKQIGTKDIFPYFLSFSITMQQKNCRKLVVKAHTLSDSLQLREWSKKNRG